MCYKGNALQYLIPGFLSVSQKMSANGNADGLGTRGGTDLREDGVDMVFYGIDGDAELAGDVLV